MYWEYRQKAVPTGRIATAKCGYRKPGGSRRMALLRLDQGALEKWDFGAAIPNSHWVPLRLRASTNFPFSSNAVSGQCPTRGLLNQVDKWPRISGNQACLGRDTIAD
jgi:hypothetical protein